MKKNFLIMMIMVLCAGFAFAQNHNTVRGFVPGAGTGAGNGDQTYAVFGQMFGNIDLNAANPYEVAEGLAQAQLIADTVEAVVGCGDSLKIGNFTLSAAAIDAIVAEFAVDPTRPRDTFLTLQRTNAAIYNYDRLMVLHLFVCPCTIDDYNGNPYDVVAIDNICWTKTNMRATTTCGGIDVVTKSYSTDVTPELDPATFGLLYTWENASKDSKCDSNYVTGICPCGWHLPTAAEVDTILKSYTNDLRSNGGYWVVPQGITNLTKFTAEPAGYYDSLATRFEGFHSEADFWYVATDSTCNADYFQIYYFCDKPKHEPRNVNTDAMSVRCVLDMIYDYRKDDPTPNPIPDPECEALNGLEVGQPSIRNEVVVSDNNVVEIKVTNFNSEYFSETKYGYTPIGSTSDDDFSGYFTLTNESTENNVTTFKTGSIPAGMVVEIRFELIADFLNCAEEGVYSRSITIPQVETCPTSYTLIDRLSDGVGLAISGDNTMVSGVTIYYEIYTGGDQPSNTISVPANLDHTESGVSYYFANPPALTTMDDVTKIVARASVSFVDDYNCTFSVNPLTYYAATNNACPTYGDVNIVNNQYKIAVGNYTPSATTQDVFTVTCVYEIGSVGQSQMVERTGNIYYDNGFVYIGLGNDVPADYCGLTFIIKLNGACEKSLLYSYCH